jgi:putative ABC transport system permease protein
MQVRVPEYRYGRLRAWWDQSPTRALLFQRLQERLEALPGVHSAAVTAKLPMKHSPDPWGFRIEGRAAPAPGQATVTAAISTKPGWYVHGDLSVQRVTPGYFRTLGLRLLSGRYLDERDSADAPRVAVINETMAKRFWPNADPAGHVITADMISDFLPMTIVGVVADAKLNALDREPFAEVFWPLAQSSSPVLYPILRTHLEPEALVPAVRRAVQQIDPDLPLLEIQSMTRVIQDSLWRPRLSAVLVSVFAALALVLAAAGVYSVTSYTVVQRLHDFAIHVALGAGTSDVLGLVLRRGLRLIMLGILLGVVASMTLGRLVSAHLFGISAHDPATLAAVSAFLMLTALASCYVPARRVLRLDPLMALRAEGWQGAAIR